MHVVCRPIIRVEADIIVISRKVIRDSIRGVSESQFGLREATQMLIADGCYYLSEGGHPVYIAFSLALNRSTLIGLRSRLARRGGIKRISGTVYDETRQAMVDRLKTVYDRLRSIDVV